MNQEKGHLISRCLQSYSCSSWLLSRQNKITEASGCSTEVDHLTRDPEIIGSNPSAVGQKNKYEGKRFKENNKVFFKTFPKANLK